MKKTEEGRFRFVETTNKEEAKIKMRWDGTVDGSTAFNDLYCDEAVPYNESFTIFMRGPPERTTLEKNNFMHIVSHEFLHTLYALGNHSPYIQDQFHSQVSDRMDQGYPLDPNERERKGMKLLIRP